MSKRTHEEGNGRIGFVFALCLVGCAIFAGSKVIPVRVAAYEFRDFVQQECRHAAVRPDDKDSVKRILSKAKELELPLQRKDLDVSRTMSEMIINASFVKSIDLKLTTYQYRFDVKERAPLF